MKPTDYVDSFTTYEGIKISYSVWLDGQGVELMFEAPMQPLRSLSLDAAGIGALGALVDSLRHDAIQQLLKAGRA